MYQVPPETFIDNPLFAITPDEQRTGVIARVLSFAFGGIVRIEAVNAYTREIFYDGVSMGIFELSPDAERFYGDDH